MSKTKENEREVQAKALESFFKRGGKIEYIETGKSGQTYNSTAKTTAKTPPAKVVPASPSEPKT
ncbi:MAG: hypothetical protein AB8B48_10720 [Pseudomonadales bacterium]